MERIGPFVLQEQLGQGGMGSVFRAVDARTQEQVALKLLASSDERSRRRFVLEARALTRLRHANVVSIIEAGEDGGRSFVALELVRGRSLQERLDREGALASREAARIVHAVALGLAHAHREGVLHRDLKPANVLLPADGGAPKLADFGLAGFTFDLSQSRLTKSGTLMGTPGYWSPEQANGEASKIGPATDVYGLGALLYAALTSRPPITGESLMAILEATKRRPDPPRKDAFLDAVALRCLEKRPEDRFPSADAVARELARYLAGRVRRRPSRTLPVVVGALALLGVAGLLAVALSDRPPPVDVAPIAPVATAPAPPPVATPPVESPPVETPPAPARQSPEVAALLERVDAAMKAADWSVARDAIERALRLDPRCAGAYARRGMLIAIRDGDLRRGLEDLDRAVALDARDARTLTDRASVKTELGDWDGALADFDQAIALGSPSTITYLGRGRTRVHLGDPVRALEDFDQAISLDPQNAAGYALRAVIKATDLNDRTGAIADMEAALRLEPDGARADGLRGDLNTLRNHPELAPRVALELKDQVRALLLEADRHLNADRYDLAIEPLDRAIALDPRRGESYVKRATARNGIDHMEGALDDCARALELDPRDTSALIVRGVIYSDAGQPELAIPEYERALSIAPDAVWAPSIRAGVEALRRRQGGTR